jgi:adenylate kinase family enzyme
MRDDDKKEVIEVRMKEYAEKTEPLLKEFHKKGVLMNFEVKKGVKDYPELKKQIVARLDKVK